MMSSYITDWGIDSLQNTKKYYVDALVKEESLSKPLHSFIDAQTDFTKTAFKSVDLFVKALGESAQSFTKGGLK